MPIIRVELSAAGLDAAIAELNEYQRKVESLAEATVERLARDGEEIAQMMAPMFTGELMSSIEGAATGNTGYIRANSDHAAFVEFGTGVVGDGTHPQPIAGWIYDKNGHGQAGWVYKKDGEFYWTNGQPANPFMYNTAQMLAQIVPDIVAEELQS